MRGSDFWMVLMPFLLSLLGLYGVAFERSMCLEKAEEFISSENPCRIRLGNVKQQLSEKSGISMCGSQTFCSVSFSYYSSDSDNKYYQFEEPQVTIFNRLGLESMATAVDLQCGNYNGDREMTLSLNIYGGCMDDNECGETEMCTMHNYGMLNRIGTCVCVDDTIRINGICRKIDAELGESCSEDIQCNKAGYNRFCDKASSTCLCLYGFTEVNGYCMKTGLEVNQTCWFDEQCNGTANSSVCRKNMCTCMAEHYYVNSTCQPSIKELPDTDMGASQSQQQLQGNESSIAHIVAAVIGGFVSGILTCFAAVYVLQTRNRKSKENRNTEVKFVNNLSYEKEISTNNQRDSRKLEETKFRPIIKENPEYSNVSQAKLESTGIYNHLNEKMGDETDMDDYDRALPVATGMSPDEEYSNLSRCTVQSARLQTEIEAQDDYAVAKIPKDVDDYSSLERQ